MAFDIDIDTTSLLRVARRYENGEAILTDEISRTMIRSLDVFEQLVVKETPVGATGAARGSITKQIFGEPLTDNYSGVVTTAIIYGQALEVGRKPGKFPPVEMAGLELWVRRKLGVPSALARGVAFAVATVISRRGTKGARMFAKGFAQGKPHVDELWRTLPARVVKRLEGGA